MNPREATLWRILAMGLLALGINKQLDLQSALTADTAQYATFFKGMLSRGIYPPPSQFEAWFLSGAHTEADIAKTIKAARAALMAVK